MRNKRMMGLTAAALLAACSAESKDTAAPQPVTAATAPKATARLQIQGAAAPAPPPFSPQALAANGVTIESASITVTEINFKGWEYDEHVNDEDRESDVEDAKDDGHEVEGASLRAAADEPDSVDGEDGEDGANEDAENEGEDDEIENVDFKGPFVVDLLTGVSTPALGEAVLPSGAYSAIEFKLDAAEDESRGSLEVAGSLDVDGVWHPFVLRNLRDEELKWKFAAPVTVTALQVNDLVLNMPLDQWVNDALVAAMADMVRSGSAVTDGTGVYVFTSDSGDVADLLEGNFENEGDVEHDHEDGE